MLQKIDRLNEIKEKIDSIINILESVDSCDNYLEFFSDIRRTIDSDNFEDAVKEISDIYGGMGSFSDLVLYKNGVVVRDENNRLDRDRASLFLLCKNFSDTNSSKETLNNTNNLEYQIEQMISLLKSNEKTTIATYFQKILNSKNIKEYLEPLKNSGSITQYADFTRLEFEQLEKIQKIASDLLLQEINGLDEIKDKSQNTLDTKDLTKLLNSELDAISNRITDKECNAIKKYIDDNRFEDAYKFLVRIYNKRKVKIPIELKKAGEILYPKNDKSKEEKVFLKR